MAPNFHKYSLAFYLGFTVLLHLPFDCPLALLPFLFPREEVAVVAEFT